MIRQTKEELKILLAGKKYLYFVERGNIPSNSFHIYFEDGGELVQIRPQNEERCPFFISIIDWGEFESGGYFCTGNTNPLHQAAQMQRIAQSLGKWLFGNPNKFIAVLL